MSHDKDIELPLLDGKSKSLKKGSHSPTKESPENFALLLQSDFSANKFQKVKPSFQYYTYTDMLPLSKLVNSSKTPITYDQLPLPYENFNIESKVHQLTHDWQEEKRQSKEPSFMKACLQTHKQEFRNTFILIFFLVNINILNAFVLGKIMNAITKISLDQETNQEETIFYALAFVVVYIFCHLLENWWSYNGLSFGVSSRLAITGLMYKKLNNIALSSLQEINTGKVLNLLTNDMNDLDAGSGSVTTMFLAPYSILLSCSLIWSYFGFHTIVSMTILVIILMSAIRLSKLSEGPRKEKNLITDQRVKYTNEFIENIRLIKLYAWEKPLRAIIQDLRDKEVVQLKKLAHIDSMARTLTESGVYIGVLFMCITYVSTGGVLTPEKVYTAFLVLGFAKFWIILAFHYGRMFLVGAKLTNKRLEEVLAVKETSSVGYLLNSGVLAGEPIKFKKFVASWKQDKPCLNISDLTIQPREFVALIGKIGSGKSTFLLSFLKEIPITSGQISFRGSLAYVEQEPVIFSGSIKYNILFGREFDHQLYQRVLQATNLDEDLQQFDNYDETIVGERGVTLSGGQKARLSLARSLYSQSDIYLLDDPLSAVDSRVGRIIFNKAIKEMLKEKTVILVTHHLDYAKEADRVVVMKDGGIEAQGKFEDLVEMKLDLLQVFSGEDNKSEENIRKKSSVLSDDMEEEDKVLDDSDKEKKPVAVAKEETTIVSNQTYFTYLRESQNYLLALTLLGIFALTQILVIVFTKFIGYWAQVQNEYNYQKDEEFSNVNYILFSLITMVAILCLSYIKAMLTSKFLLDTNSKLHEKMLYKISRTFVAFFDATPIGSVINRFSNDLGTLDRGNFPIIYDLMDLLFALAFYLLYLCFINFFIAIPALIVIYSLYKVKDFFAKPSLELKRVELTSRSPIFSEISSTLHGLLIIRVYHQSQRFIDNFLDLLYKNSRAYTSVLRTNRIFSICLQTLLYLLCVSGVLLFIYIAYYSDIEPGVFGLALFYLITLANTSTWAIRQSIFLDINMQSAQRVQQYCILPEEAPSHLQNEKNKSLSEGNIEFKNVYLKYPNTSNYALNGLSFTVEPGMKIGIVGRTGAGKSSIIQALFRIVEIEKKADSNITIDQTDISTLGLETLRKNISILPQTPVIFTGTIRRNLDPFGMIPEERLWEALEQASLKDYVRSLEKGLDTDMSVSSSVFSVGQKQLICLARVILQKSKIVILDEATANVDVSTDRFIQEKINEIFKDCVVLTIAHRLSTIAHYDRVLVLEKGVKAEYDHPYRLLVEEVGDREITKQKGKFAEMVRRSGQKVSQEIFNIAYTKFMKNDSS